MASWIVHLRIAEKLLAHIPEIDASLFAVGNIAPDSGIPDATWEHFRPPPEITHFLPGPKTEYRCGDYQFFSQYLQPLRGAAIDPQHFSFVLGYFFHLLTDNNWSRRIGRPTQVRYAEQFQRDRLGMWDAVKSNWYGLDYIYVREHPESLFWRVFLNASYNRNDLEFLPVEAVQQRIVFIQTYYQTQSEEVDAMIAGPFIYLNKTEMDAVVDETACLCLEAYQRAWVSGADWAGCTSVLERLD